MSDSETIEYYEQALACAVYALEKSGKGRQLLEAALLELEAEEQSCSLLRDAYDQL